MAIRPAMPTRAEGTPRVRPLLEALQRAEDRILSELAVRAGPQQDNQALSRAAESTAERLQTLEDDFEALTQRLERAQRSALQEIVVETRDLRDSLRLYTAVMAVAVILVVLLLAVVILFKIT